MEFQLSTKNHTIYGLQLIFTHMYHYYGSMVAGSSKFPWNFQKISKIFPYFHAIFKLFPYYFQLPSYFHTISNLHTISILFSYYFQPC